MSSEDFDMSELFEFTGKLLKLAETKAPKETRKFLAGEGTKFRKKVVKRAKQSVKQQTGNYIKGIKRGKVYKFEGDQMAVRVYGSSPHAHLIEYGHRQVTPSGKEVGFVKGKRVFEKSRQEFESEFIQDCEDFLDELLDEGLS